MENFIILIPSNQKITPGSGLLQVDKFAYELPKYLGTTEVNVNGKFENWSGSTVHIEIVRPDGKIDDFMSKNRIKEQQNSAKILGAKVDILDLDPYDFSFTRKYIKIFDKKINEYKPDVIFSCWEHDTHQDHKNLSDILFAVSRKNNISINMYEVMLPGGLNTYSFNPQYFVNISKYFDVKIASIKSYKSVFEKNPNNYSQYFESITGRAKFRGGVIGVDYAEAFVIAKKIEI